MKRKILFFLITVFLNFHFFSEIVNWEGMEVGTNPYPQWLKNYINNKNEKLLRKKFDIEKSKNILIGIGKSDDITKARYFSQIDAQQKFSEHTGREKKTRLEFIYEYWMEDDETGFLVYSIYAW